MWRYVAGTADTLRHAGASATEADRPTVPLHRNAQAVLLRLKGKSNARFFLKKSSLPDWATDQRVIIFFVLVKKLLTYIF